VSNQSGVGRGYYTLADVEAVNATCCANWRGMASASRRFTSPPKRPTSPAGAASPRRNSCSTPRTSFGLDLAQSYMVGDKLIDLECGWNAGVRASLHRPHRSARPRADVGDKRAGVVLDDLAATAEWIMQHG